MYVARSLWAVALLCSAVRAGLTNYTLDDTSPAIIYTQTPILRCSPGVCDPGWIADLFNRTSSQTAASIIVPFTGSAVYVYLGLVGSCGFNLDGKQIGRFVQSNFSDTKEIFLAFHDYGLPDAPHVLTIYPEQNGHTIQFDYIVYSHNPRKSHLGAIVGGVVGGVAAAAILSGAAYFIRRREKRRRISTRGIPLGDSWPDKPSIKLVGMAHQK
ncbi:hypothetical protein B0H19DRAFT_1187430 [Mycena capillaripes]|nr:hypothetical protein B0H19DRAFT_1187430 [Mycena capillaripes]